MPALEPCHTRQSFATQFIPRGFVNLPSLLHVANDMSHNCLWEVTTTAPFPQLTAIPDADGALSNADYSMGTDFYYDGTTGDVVMLSVEIGYHLLYALRDGTLVDESDRLPPTEKDYVGWGGVFVDADNDGDEDVVIASGRTWTDDQLLAFSSQWLPIGVPAEVSRLLFWEQGTDGAFTYDNALAGDRFDAESGEYFGVAVGDLNHDGCQDLVISLRELMDRNIKIDPSPEAWTPEIDAWTFRGPGVRVLLNNCMVPANRYAALRVPDRPGYVAEVTLSNGERRFQAVKGTRGTGSRSGGGVLHFGLGPELTVVQADLYAPSGEHVATTAEVALDAVTSLAP